MGFSHAQGTQQIFKWAGNFLQPAVEENYQNKKTKIQSINIQVNPLPNAALKLR